MPLISVGMPVLNAEKTVGMAIRNLLAQTFQDFETIIVDDGSTDQTSALLAAEYPQVQCLVQANQGVSAARNAGIAAAKGRWIALLDSDDQWHRDKLEKQRDAWIKSPSHRIIHGDEVWIRDGVRVNKKSRYSKSLSKRREGDCGGGAVVGL